MALSDNGYDGACLVGRWPLIQRVLESTINDGPVDGIEKNYEKETLRRELQQHTHVLSTVLTQMVLV